jgi:hypothetical protein
MGNHVLRKTEMTSNTSRKVFAGVLSVAGLVAAGGLLLGGRVNGAEAAPTQLFTSREGQFTVSMPTTPEQREVSVEMAGVKIVIHLFVAESAGKDRGYAVNYLDVPGGVVAPADVDALLTKVGRGSVVGMQGRMRKMKDIELGRHPGKEFEADIEGGAAALRVYYVQGRIYQVIIAGSGLDPASLEAQDFLTSFQLTR